jgi:hypothetical protein
MEKILHFLTEHGSDYHQMWLKEAQCHVEAFNTLPHTQAHWHIVPEKVLHVAQLKKFTFGCCHVEKLVPET